MSVIDELNNYVLVGQVLGVDDAPPPESCTAHDLPGLPGLPGLPVLAVQLHVRVFLPPDPLQQLQTGQVVDEARVPLDVTAAQADDGPVGLGRTLAAHDEEGPEQEDVRLHGRDVVQGGRDEGLEAWMARRGGRVGESLKIEQRRVAEGLGDVGDLGQVGRVDVGERGWG
ncbi:hypothetical protein FQN49_007366 [Arthroderma sp. PD_2]|nr:hypothetical protein FQN49_007366 [Arthroderma sp. PD_2]